MLFLKRFNFFINPNILVLVTMNITCFIRFLFLFMLIGSIIGLSMPQYKTESPVICKVENRNADDLALQNVC